MAANLSAVTASDVAAVKIIEAFDAPAAEDLVAGDVVRLDTTYGTLTNANDSDAAEGRAAGILLNTAATGRTGTVLRKGIVDLGDIFSALGFDAAVYLSDTDGLLRDASGSTGKVIGAVVPAFAYVGTSDKLLRVNL